jgi:hypothetical protein
MNYCYFVCFIYFSDSMISQMKEIELKNIVELRNRVAYPGIPKAGQNITKGDQRKVFFQYLFKCQRGYTYLQKIIFQF